MCNAICAGVGCRGEGSALACTAPLPPLIEGNHFNSHDRFPKNCCFLEVHGAIDYETRIVMIIHARLGAARSKHED